MEKHKLTLICENCGKKAKYSIANIVISDDFIESIFEEDKENDFRLDNNILILEYFHCKSCQSPGPFKLTDKSIAAILSEIIHLPFQKDIEESFLLIGEVVLEDGTYFQTAAMCEKYILTKIKEDPNNESLYLWLGNIYKTVGLLDKSLVQYHKVLEIKENNLEVLLSLGDIYVSTKNLEKGLNYYYRLLEKSPNEKSLDKNNLREFVEYAINSVLNIRLDPKCIIDEDIPILPVADSNQTKNKIIPKNARVEEFDLSKEKDWKLLINLYLPGNKQYTSMEKSFRYKQIKDELIYDNQFEPSPDEEPSYAATKVHRNDPCPCGSGLKYKKCCGKIQP